MVCENLSRRLTARPFQQGPRPFLMPLGARHTLKRPSNGHGAGLCHPRLPHPRPIRHALLRQPPSWGHVVLVAGLGPSPPRLRISFWVTKTAENHQETAVSLGLFQEKRWKSHVKPRRRARGDPAGGKELPVLHPPSLRDPAHALTEERHHVL